MRKNIAIIGGGIGGLASAVRLAHAGHHVEIFEKNAKLGGVCNQFSEDGFTFDTGPSWYLMPEVYEEFFNSVGENIRDYLTLVRLNPSQRAFFDTKPEVYEFKSDFEKDKKAFESLAPESFTALKKYFARTKRRYDIAIPHIRNERSESLSAYMKLFFSGKVFGLGRMNTMQREVYRTTRSSELRAMLVVPSLFLGTMPWRVPALFSFLSYADFGLGTWYPMGGMYKIVEALVAIGKKNGVVYHTSSPVRSIETENGRAMGLVLKSGETYAADIILSNADRSHTETLLPASDRDHSDAFWERKIPTFGAILIFLGVNKKLPALAHHNFFFSEHWDEHLADIERGVLSENPSVYVCMPSATDPSCAPAGMENVFVLIPTPASSALSKQDLDACADRVIEKIATRVPAFKDSIVLDRRWYPSDFGEKYNSFKNSALGLALTHFQTAPFRPSHTSRRLSNLYFVGSTTNPGAGLPACFLSAERVTKEIARGI